MIALSMITDWRAEDWWVVAIAACGNSACALLGTFLVLRRLSLLGDAISHAILPGLAVAFLVTGTRAPWAMLLGAGLAGLAAVGLVSALSRRERVTEDAALGVVFSSFFAVGVILISFAARRVDLDPGCVLYGMIEFAPFDTVDVAGFMIPRAFLWLSIVLVIDLSLVGLFFKELRIVSFDPGLATTMGISAALVHAGLLIAVTSTAVAAFESVGSILVIAMLVVPGATAQLLSDRLVPLLLIAVGLGLVTAVLGYALAVELNTSVAGSMSVVGGALFALAALASPRHGLLSRALRRLLLSLRIHREDLLAALWRREERGRASAHPLASGVASGLASGVASGVASGGASENAARSAAGGVLTRLARLAARRAGEVATRDGALVLTDAGRERGAALVRGHRLWEGWLSQNLGLPEDHLHEPSHRMEHFIDAELRERLAREVGSDVDPHGRPIPEVASRGAPPPGGAKPPAGGVTPDSQSGRPPRARRE